jgi:6-pyruvoyltetrahydropterin/6-carboxytetrahydropterin synthase
MYKLQQDFQFKATRTLFGLPDNDPRSQPHVIACDVQVLFLSNTLGKNGFIETELTPIWFGDWLKRNIENKDLNTVFAFNPTAENLARYFFGVCKANWNTVALVRVSDTPGVWVTYSNP